ncbi:MAG: ABC transporter ATP-binding protein [Pseudomonadota bacterium]
MSTPMLKLTGISKRFGKTDALVDIEMVVPRGTLTVVLGPAGAGKTTMLRTIAGLETPQSGRIEIDGWDMTHVEPRARDLAMIFDNLALYPNRTGRENIAFPLKVAKTPQAEIKVKVDQMADLLRIHHILDRLPKTMSGGERQRIALGRALIRDPHLYLLDEPLSSLDAMLRLELRAELKRLQAERNYTFLMATPDFSEALAVADQVVLLREGRIRQVGPPQEIYLDPVDREAAAFVGAPKINLLPAQVERREDGLYLNLGAVSVPCVAGLPFAEVVGDERFELGIRPEDLTVCAPSEGALTGTVTDYEPQGLKSALTVSAGGLSLRTVVGPEDGVSARIGDEVGLVLHASHFLAFDLDTGLRLKSFDDGSGRDQARDPQSPFPQHEGEPAQ